MNFKRSDSLD